MRIISFIKRLGFVGSDAWLPAIGSADLLPLQRFFAKRASGLAVLIIVDVLTKTGLGYTLSLATVAPTIPAFPVIGPNNFLVSISLFCSLHTYPPVSALLNPTTAALVPRPVGSSTLLLVVLILLSVLQVACAPCVRITTCSFVGSLV